MEQIDADWREKESDTILKTSNKRKVHSGRSRVQIVCQKVCKKNAIGTGRPVRKGADDCREKENDPGVA